MVVGGARQKGGQNGDPNKHSMTGQGVRNWNSRLGRSWKNGSFDRNGEEREKRDQDANGRENEENRNATPTSILNTKGNQLRGKKSVHLHGKHRFWVSKVKKTSRLGWGWGVKIFDGREHMWKQTTASKKACKKGKESDWQGRPGR